MTNAKPEGMTNSNEATTKLGIARRASPAEPAGQRLSIFCYPCNGLRCVSVDALISRVGAGYPVGEVERKISCPMPGCRSRSIELRIDLHESNDPANAVTPDEE
jgi:hypothetical protein